LGIRGSLEKNYHNEINSASINTLIHSAKSRVIFEALEKGDKLPDITMISRWNERLTRANHISDVMVDSKFTRGARPRNKPSTSDIYGAALKVEPRYAPPLFRPSFALYTFNGSRAVDFVSARKRAK